MDLATREPLAIRAAVIAALDSLIHLAVVFGLSLSSEQTLALSATVNTLSILTIVLWSRGKVTPTAVLEAEAGEEYVPEHSA